MNTIKTLKQAKQYAVVAKGNSKIHGSTFSTDPFQCKVGGKLRDIEGSTCNKCYAIKLAKIYPSALQSWKDNLTKFRQFQENKNYGDLYLWAESVAFQINKISQLKEKKGEKGAGFHRWFSSGDLDSLEMLRAIIEVCKLTPNIKHWLPTRETGIIRQHLNVLGEIPENLTIRISDTKINQDKHVTINHKRVTFSGVHSSKGTDKPKTNTFECPAYSNNGECGDCTACWKSTVKSVSYKLH